LRNLRGATRNMGHAEISGRCKFPASGMQKR
jgi:hypothetical protein